MMNDLNTLPSLKHVVDQFGLAAKKTLGQHFLLDTRVTDKIVRYAGDITGCHVIEVGPGPGGLTRSLLAAGAKQVIAVEKDDRCLAALAQIKAIAGERLRIEHGDAMVFDPIASTPAPRMIVANLPYNVGTALLLDWLDAIDRHGPEAFVSLTLMFQKEVAERIVASHNCKDYGRLSVLSQWLCDCRYDFELPPGVFSPPPKISSAIVTLTPRVQKRTPLRKHTLEQVMAKAFGQRRKMLRSALKGMAVPADHWLEEAGIDGTRRAEQLDIDQLCHLAQVYEKIIDSRKSP
jgi:16S rRNA (adenine1518-N6/adenine1519-N6)-dimethyltransferase